MRQGKVFYKDNFAGFITETNEGEYQFAYNAYIQRFPNQSITFSMPVSDKVYQDNRLSPFFEGLIPEGWLLEIATKSNRSRSVTKTFAGLYQRCFAKWRKRTTNCNGCLTGQVYHH